MYFTLPFDLVFYIRMTPFFVAVNLLPWSAVPVKAYCKSLPPYLLHHRAQMFDCTCAWDPFRCNVFFFAVIISAQLCWIFVMPFECSIGSGCWPHWHPSFICLGTPCGSDETKHLLAIIAFHVMPSLFGAWPYCLIIMMNSTLRVARRRFLALAFIFVFVLQLWRWLCSSANFAIAHLILWVAYRRFFAFSFAFIFVFMLQLWSADFITFDPGHYTSARLGIVLISFALITSFANSFVSLVDTAIA